MPPGIPRSLAAGAKLPSVRALARTLRVSVSTVVEGYGRLAAEGAIVSRPGSGFYVADQIAPAREASAEILAAVNTFGPIMHQFKSAVSDLMVNRDAALEELLELVRRDRKWNEEAGRKQLVTLFEAMGPTDPRTIEARRRLSGLLFS